MENYFVTDLDKTIIYSKNPNHRCVEHMENRQITYMTEKSYFLLKELLKKVEFIPCTMRNLRQTLRIDFVREYEPKYIICTNGAQIYINGELDEYWNDYMNTLIKPDEINELINNINTLGLNLKENRNIENFYITLKFYNENDAKNSIEYLKEIVGDNYVISQSGIKVFLIKEEINKANALDYLKNKYKFKHIHTAGDSVYDKRFTGLNYVHNYLPFHAEFRHDNSFISNQAGIYASEDILESILNNLK